MTWTPYDSYTGTVNNFVAVAYPGSSNAFYFGGNNFATDDEYLPERVAINSQTQVAVIGFGLIRNAMNIAFSFSNAETGEVYMREEMGAPPLCITSPPMTPGPTPLIGFSPPGMPWTPLAAPYLRELR